MSENKVLKAVKRERAGKGSSRELRRNGQIPAVIYGDKQPAISIAVSYKEIFYLIYGGGFKNTLFTIDIDGKKLQVLPKDYQLDPVRDFPLHVDFLRVSAKSIMDIKIPVHFKNEDQAPGLKNGGVLNIINHEVEITVPAHSIPDGLEVDLTGLEVGDSIHVSAINLPEGATLAGHDLDYNIATILAPTVRKEDAAEDAEGETEAE